MKHLLGWWFKSLLLVLQAVLKSEFCVSEGLLWSGGALGCGQSDSFQVVLKDSWLVLSLPRRTELNNQQPASDCLGNKRDYVLNQIWDVFKTHLATKISVGACCCPWRIAHLAIPRSESKKCPSAFFRELERLSNLVGKPSENHPLHNSGLLSLDPVQDKTPLYSQLLQAYKWSNKVTKHLGVI